MLTASNFQNRRTNSFNFYAQFLQKETDILHHVIWTSIADDCRIWRQRRRHNDIFRHCIAALRQKNRSIARNYLSLRMIIFRFCRHIHTKTAQAAQMRLNRALA